MLQERTITYIAILLSLLVSAYLSYTDLLINRDGTLYLNVARYLMVGEWDKAYQLYSWPFYSALIAGFGYLTHLPLDLAARVLNAALLAFLVWSFLKLTQIWKADSLKAKLTAEGNRLMKAFCKEHHLPVNECQKVVVARNENERNTLTQLYHRGLQNGVDVQLVSEQELHTLDPSAKTNGQALLSPSTASVDPQLVCFTLKKLLQKAKVDIFCNQKVLRCDDKIVQTQNQSYSYTTLINCAGLYADKIAHQMGVGQEFVLLPFKGRYLKCAEPTPIKTHIYPVPNLNNPFLGVHCTQTVEGNTKIGPTAIPALWREHYQGLSRFNLSEFLEMSYYLGKLWALNAFNFRTLALSEFKKYKNKTLIAEAQALANQLGSQFKKMPAGIRAQLLNRHKNELVMDFVVKRTHNSIHVLNAVSPAFTCAFSIARFIVEGSEEGKL